MSLANNNMTFIDLLLPVKHAGQNTKTWSSLPFIHSFIHSFLLQLSSFPSQQACHHVSSVGDHWWPIMKSLMFSSHQLHTKKRRVEIVIIPIYNYTISVQSICCKCHPNIPNSLLLFSSQVITNTEMKCRRQTSLSWYCYTTTSALSICHYALQT